jgi:hypothetical protein
MFLVHFSAQVEDAVDGVAPTSRGRLGVLHPAEGASRTIAVTVEFRPVVPEVTSDARSYQ